MRTTVVVDDALMKKILELTKEKNKSRLINRALQDYVQKLRIEQLKKLSGKINIEDNWQRLRELEKHEI